MDTPQSILIKKSIEQAVHTQVKQQQLKEQLLGYAGYHAKLGFPFGELLVLHYNQFNGIATDDIYAVAAAVEILILSFDMLDDFEDEDCIDKPWSTQTNLALNSTTALLFLSVDAIRTTDFPNKDRAMDILIRYALRSINGQHQDLLNSSRNEKDYIEMTIEKSGSLTALACLIGTVLATDDYPEEIETYAELIGLVGQISNDLKDITTWNEKNDLLNKKYTLPIIYLLNHPDEDLQLVRDYYNNKLSADEIRQNRELISRKFVETGAITYTEVIKKMHQNRALNEVKKLQIDQQYMDRLVTYIQ
ncbi:polyprenyl synthetase family protein [Sporosarcina sp. ACRSM]|uniref:polyprenyl synthetase family protein n=1 Tax=Sporosarcina sp. ACRSM TaxID=2918216 RepID=UPI001EF70116|nr:polyprenyl synthetase family protein [Sporosarcina sp. ACRSM]MCG7336724.1 polyprenyl synthetase family protein [Sporosarcina sp. ACRSM]